MLCTKKHITLVIFATVVLLQLPFRANADVTLLNGNFSTPGTAGQLGYNTTLVGWTGGGHEGTFGSQTTPPVFVFPTGAGQTGVTGDPYFGTVSFYGVTPSPDGSFFVAADGDPTYQGAISQLVSGLNNGDSYAVNFNWAGAQQQGYSGSTMESWRVSLGSSSISTAMVSTDSQSFAGWQTASLAFTADSVSEQLIFSAIGSPTGQAPWLLLDGVSLTDTTSRSDTPEPGYVLVLSAGFVVLAGFRHRRKAQL